MSRLNNALLLWSKTDLLRSLIFTGKKYMLEQLNVLLIIQFFLITFRDFPIDSVDTSL